MKLAKDGHLVETSSATEQVNLKARGYTVVPDTPPVIETSTKNTNKKEKSDD